MGIFLPSRYHGCKPLLVKVLVCVLVPWLRKLFLGTDTELAHDGRGVIVAVSVIVAGVFEILGSRAWQTGPL